MTEVEALAVMLRHVSLGKASDVDPENYFKAFKVVDEIAKRVLVTNTKEPSDA